MSAIAGAILRVRPLSSAHWSLSAALVGVALIFWVAEPCKIGPFYLEAVAATVAVCLVVWANHVAAAPLLSAKAVATVVARSLYDVFGLFVLYIVASIPLAIFVPTYQCYTDRAKASEVLLAGSVLRPKIEAWVTEHGSLTGSGRGMSLAQDRRVRGGLVTNDGVIIIAGDDPPVVFILSPALVQGKVEWKCYGYPAKVAPASCREKDNV